MIGLTHTVTIERPTSATEDDYGQPIPGMPTTRTGVKAAIQPKRAEEIALTNQAGATSADYRIFLLPMDLTTYDRVIHDALDCPMRPDLPDSRYEITAVPDAAGLGHHLEVEAKLVGGAGVAGS